MKKYTLLLFAFIFIKGFSKSKWYAGKIKPVTISNTYKTTIQINGNTREYKGGSLEDAIGKTSTLLTNITEIKVISGEFITADWNYLKNNIEQLDKITDFTVTDAVKPVADIPDTRNGETYFAPQRMIFTMLGYAEKNATIKNISIANLKKIGNYAFENLSTLETVNFPDVTEIGDYALAHSVKLTLSSFPMLQKIGNSTFKDCKRLTTITLPEITDINEDGFKDCLKLNKIKLGKTPPNVVGIAAFLNTATDRTVYFLNTDGTTIEPKTTDFNTIKKGYDDVTMGGSSVNKTDDNLWYNWKTRGISSVVTQVIYVKLNGNTTEYGGTSLENAIANAMSAMSINESSVIKLEVVKGDFKTDDWNYLKHKGSEPTKFTTMTDFIVTDGIHSIVDVPDITERIWFNYAYLNRKTIKNISIAKLDKIGANAFRLMKVLENVTLANTTFISEKAFQLSKKLEVLTAPKLTTIDKYGFDQCGFVNLDLPELVRINESGFSKCASLETGKFPKLNIIKQRAFALCDNFIAIKLKNTLPTVEGDAVFKVNNLTDRTIYFLDNSGNEINPTDIGFNAVENIYDNYILKGTGNKINDNLWYNWKTRGTSAVTPVIYVKLNGNTTEYGGTSLENAIANAMSAMSSVSTLSNIIKLEVVKGKFVVGDWGYLKDKKDSFTAITDFIVKYEITSVADIPDTQEYKSYFKAYGGGTIKNISVAKVKKIGAYAFYDCKSIETAVFKDATDAGIYVFGHNESLNSVEIPNLETLGYRSFFNCKLLKEINFPKLEKIEENTFKYCEKLEKAILPSLKEISGTASYTGDCEAFSGCESLVEIKLGKTPPTLEDNTIFKDTPNTRYVKFINVDGTDITDFVNTEKDYDNNVTIHSNIANDNLWYGWITNTKTVTSIIYVKLNGNTTEYGGKSLENAIANAITAMSSISSLSDITKLEVVKGKFLSNDWTYLSDKNKKFTAIKEFIVTDGMTSVVNIPDSTSSFGGNGYFNSTIQKIEIHKITEVGASVFGELNNLTHIKLPKVTKIGRRTFINCTLLKFVDIPELEFLGQFGFTRCEALETLAFPKLTDIKGGAFKDCSKLNTLKLGKTKPNVEEITQTFIKVPKIRYVKFINADGTDMIGTDFITTEKDYDNNVAVHRNVADNNLWYGWITNTKTVTPIIYVKLNGNTTEYGGTNLENAITNAITAMSSVSTLSDITKLEVVKGKFLSSDWTYLRTKKSDFTKMTDFTVIDNTNIISVANIPNTTNANGAYFNTDVIEKVSISKITSIGINAFKKCKKLKEVTIPTVEIIYSGAFMECVALPSISFLNVTEIREASFKSCLALKKATLPKVIEIKQQAFGGCSSFETIKLGSTAPTVTHLDVFDRNPTPRKVKFINTDGSDITATDFLTTEKNYDDNVTAHSNVANDNLWYGWITDTAPVATCDVPTNVEVDNITETTATINWSDSANIYEYVISTTNATPIGSGISSTTTSISKTGLIENTTYYVYVRSICSPTSKSTWTVVEDFTTDTLTTPTIISENFDIKPAFSPNGDNINEFWEIGILKDNPKNSVEIFTRWGGLIFKTKGYNNYNKNFKGFSNIGSPKELPQGTYFYRIQYNNLVKTGSLELRR